MRYVNKFKCIYLVLKRGGRDMSKIKVFLVTKKEFQERSGIQVGDRYVFEDNGRLRHVWLYPDNDLDGYTIGEHELDFQFDPKRFKYKQQYRYYEH